MNLPEEIVVNLTDIFPPSLGWAAGKLLEAAYVPTAAAPALASIAEIRRVMTAYQQALADRGVILGESEMLSHTYRLLGYAHETLDRHYSAQQGGTDTSLDADAAYIFASFIRAELPILRESAAENDHP